MGLRFNVRCKACNIIKAETIGQEGYTNSTLYKYLDKHKLQRMTVVEVSEKYPQLKPYNIHLHCKNHQTVSQHKLQKQKINEATLAEVKAELIELKTRVFSIEQTKGDISELTEWLMKEVREGNVKPSLGPLVNLVGKAAAIHEKEVDQGISMMSLMAKYTSGEVKQLDKPDAA